jgi:Tfp pilus assembly ATPase PilU
METFLQNLSPLYKSGDIADMNNYRSNFSVDAFKLEFLMMRSATDEKWLLKL